MDIFRIRRPEAALGLWLALATATPFPSSPLAAEDGKDTAATASEATAQRPTWAERREAEEEVRAEAQANLARKRETLVQEAIRALEDARAVLDMLAEGEPAKLEDLYARLRSALGRLDLVIARDPGLAVAPVDVRPVVIEFGGTLENVRETRSVIEDMVEEGRLQPARRALRPFAEEIVIRVLSVPLVAHRDALLLTARLVDAGRYAEARDLLETALASLVAEDEVLPLPLLRAAAYLDQLERLLRTGRSLTEAQRDAARKAAEVAVEDASPEVAESEDPEVFLREIDHQLQRAEAFGYIVEDRLEELTGALEEIRGQLDDRPAAADAAAALARRIRALYGETETGKRTGGE